MTAFRMSMLSLLCIASCSLYAQQFGGNPPSTKWRQINSDTMRIIFPAGLETQARQVASIVHAISGATLETAGGRQHKVDIIFQNQTTVSNGFVSLAPFRSEFQLTADQNSFEIGSLPWQQQLVIHEYRHVQQYNNYRIGLSKLMYVLFGEGGQELANSLSVPNWFWEGDAVYQETLISKQGRGRLPYFFNGYHSLWAAGKNYSYQKLRNGSLRDYTPDHYPLGYMLVAYGREKYGPDFWKKVTTDAASFKGFFYPLQNAVTRYSNLSFNRFRENALDHFRSEAKTVNQTDTAANFARAHRHFVADEEFPQFVDRGHIIFMQSTYKKIPVFVIRDINTGNEDVVGTRSISLDNYFSYRNGKIVYAAYEPDARWGWKDYSVLRVLNTQTGDDRSITSRSKYFAPDISADGNHIVAMQSDEFGKSALHILNASNGEVEKVVPNKEGLFYTYPKYFNERQFVSAVRNPKGEMALATIEMADGKANYLTPFSMQVIGFLSVQGDTIYFSATHHGHDGFFAAVNGHIFRVIVPGLNTSTGSYQLQAANGNYTWSTFTAVGYTIFHTEANNIQLDEMSADSWKAALDLQGIHSLENGPVDLLDKISFSDYPVTKYPSSYRLFNFHSWRPYITDPDYSLSLVSENVLSTLQSELFVDYNRDEHYTQIGADASYAQLFPWIDAGIDYTFNRNTLFRNQRVTWNEAQARVGLSVPLNFTKSKSYTNLQFGTDLIYNQRYYQGTFKDSFSTGGFAYIKSFINFSNQSQQARQQIYPRFAQALSLTYNRAVTSIDGNQFLATGSIYLPGLAYTHNFVINAAFQQHDSLHQVSFSNSFPFSRGYSAENFYRMYRFAGNYNFPLVYPDWGFADIVYFQRIRANVYYDYTKVLDFFSDGSRFQPQYRSVGLEVYFDTQWWNQLSINFGIRYSRLLDPDYEGRGPNQWEFILPINLLGK